MISLFSKKKRNQQSTSPLTETAATKVATLILRTQHRWATALDKLTRNWSTGQKKLALVLFCLLLGANSGIALFQVLRPTPARRLSIDPPAMAVPRLEPVPDKVQGQAARRELQYYRHLLDSLKRDSSGAVLYNQLRVERPGLIDTIDLLTGKSSDE